MEAFRQVQIKELPLAQFQTNVARVFGPLLKIAMLDGVLLKDVAIRTGGTEVQHGLGRAPIGFIVVGKQGPGDIYETQSSELTITLQSSADVVSHIWVY